jgi:HAD superfamily hydrolase (TIGR01549 family)
VLLDFDDTLIDNSVVPAGVERACHEIAAAVDTIETGSLLRANTSAWMSYWPEVERSCWLGQRDVLDVSQEVWQRALLQCGVDDPSIVALAFDTHQRIGRETDRLFDDVDDFLASLRDADIVTVLVSNSSMRSQLARLETVGLASWFDAVVISGEIGVAKPDAAIFEAALARVNVTTNDVWHVGDSLSTDIAGAIAAGIKSVWLNRAGRKRGPSDPAPTYEVPTLRGLDEMLLEA